MLPIVSTYVCFFFIFPFPKVFKINKLLTIEDEESLALSLYRMDNTNDIYDLVIVGGGVVGSAVLRAATLKGYKCALIEKDKHLLSHASGSNSGIACTGVDASPGTLERALIRDANSMFRIYCKEHNIPTRPCGSLVCAWDMEQKNKLYQVLDESLDAGDTHASILSPSQVQLIEPNLNKKCLGATHIPGEVVVDPWIYSISLAVHARENGAKIFTNFEFDPDASYLDKKNNIWSVIEKCSNDKSPKILKAKTIVNATGIFSDLVQKKSIGSISEKSWTAKPRRGQYRIYSSSLDTCITHPIQPIPTQRTKGIFVFSTIYNQIVVGPTALDQSSRTDRSIDPKVANQLDDYVKSIIPAIDIEQDFVGHYVGIRPGTNKRDYQIHLYPNERWVAVAGIRSTGLTASLGIGNYVVRLLNSILESPTEIPNIKTSPMPHLSDMVRDFHTRNGFVQIQNFEYKVTHPLTICGWRERDGIAGHVPRM